MATSTARIQLLKPTGPEFVDVTTQLDNNWDKIDTNIGTVVCTSSTRPSSPYSGQLIFETDNSALCVWDTSVSPNRWRQVNTTAKSQDVLTSESTSSTGYTDLTTLGPAQNIYLHAFQPYKVTVQARTTISTGGGGHSSHMSFAVSGTETVVANDVNGFETLSADNFTTGSSVLLIANSNEGLRTITAKYRTTTGTDTSTFVNRRIIVEATT